MGRRRIAGVLFDKDGTLFDFTATWRGAAETALASLAGGDVDLTRALGRAVGYDPTTRRFAPGSPVVSGSTRDVAESAAPLLVTTDVTDIEQRLNDIAASAGAAELAPAVSDLPGFLDRLLAEGRALGVATHDSEQAARRHLEAVGALARFDFICGYDSGYGLKPGPGMVRAFAEAVDADVAQVAMVGDSLHDLGAARAAGAGLAVGVLTGPALETELAPLADVVLPSISELPGFIARWEAEG